MYTRRVAKAQSLAEMLKGNIEIRKKSPEYQKGLRRRKCNSFLKNLECFSGNLVEYENKNNKKYQIIDIEKKFPKFSGEIYNYNQTALCLMQLDASGKDKSGNKTPSVLDKQDNVLEYLIKENAVAIINHNYLCYGPLWGLLGGFYYHQGMFVKEK